MGRKYGFGPNVMFLQEGVPPGQPGSQQTPPVTPHATPPPAPPATPPAEPPATPPASPTFTQEQVNQIVLGRARELVQRELGIDLDAAKKTIAEAKNLEEAQKTEQQKAIDKAVKEAKEKADAEWQQKVEAATRQNNLVLVQGELKAKAAAGFHNVDTVWIHAQSQVDLEGTDPNKPLKVVNGAVVGVDDYLKKLAKDHPYLAKQGNPPGTPPGFGGGPSTETDTERKKRLAEHADSVIFGLRR